MNDCSEEKQFLVEGTSCTLFDVREKACEVDGEKLLIPWCGDTSILIDRFDGRGYLTDIYEGDPNCDLSPDDQLSEEEIAIEKMCDFERYLEMQVDVHELAIQDGCFLEWDMQFEPDEAMGISILSIRSSET